MCGRYRLSNAERFAEVNDIHLGATFFPRFNIAPTQTVLTVLNETPSEFSQVKWGLIPFFTKDDKGGARMINARAETVATLPAFRAAFQNRRCLIPADGFYEWQKIGTGKQPYNLQLKSGEPFAFAGIWEEWTAPHGEKLRTCSIITGKPNKIAAPIHDRMPVILPTAHCKAWLHDSTAPAALLAMLVPYASDEMTAFPISPRVGSPKNDDPAIIEPLKEISRNSAAAAEWHTHQTSFDW
jgi:putative SOS response-associated peptidase YedK